MTKVAVIGAGMCGISCASYLQKNGFGVTVFEKSRGIGGRMASRRINEQVSVDHGAQYIKPYSKNFLKCYSFLVCLQISSFLGYNFSPCLKETMMKQNLTEQFLLRNVKNSYCRV